MANFCTQCGASVPAGNQFCTACGAPVAAAGASAVPPPASGPAPSPAWTPVAPPPPAPAASPAWTPVATPPPASAASPGWTPTPPPPPAPAASPAWTPVATPPPASAASPGWAPASTPPPASAASPGWAPVATPPPAASASPGWAPVGAAPAGTVQQRSGGAVKVILIIVGAVVGLGILCVALVMFGLWRVSRHVHVGNNGDVSISTPGGTLSTSGSDGGTVKISTPDGTLTTGNAAKVSASDLGIDIYPGATRHEGGMQIATAKGSTVSAVFSTDDSLDKVIAFYKDKMGQGISVFQNEQGAILSMNTADSKNSVVVTISTDTGATDGHTKIAIMHTKST